MIYTGNSLDILRSLEDNAVDCVITDPPYCGFDGMESDESYCDWFEGHFFEMKRICRSDEHIVVSQPQNRFHLFRQRFNFRSCVKIDNAMEDSRGDDAYFLLQAQGVHNALAAPEDFPADIIPESTHPNDRSIEKMAVIVKAMSNVGDIVLDPFCGSGAIGVACILHGRKYIGIELIKKRSDDALLRIESALKYVGEVSNKGSN